MDGGKARLGVAVTRPLPGARIIVSSAGTALLDRRVDLAPEAPFTIDMPLPRGKADDLELLVRAADGTNVIAYEPKPIEHGEPPPPATEPPPPDEIVTVEELYLIGRHLEQYRHATRAPEPYWREGIRRDPGDSRCNTALGALSLIHI